MMLPELAGYQYTYQPGTAKRTLVLLHGTGGNEDEMAYFGRLLDDQASLLAVRGNVQDNGQNRYFARLSQGIYDWDDLRQRTLDMQLFIYQASQIYGFETKEVIMIGYSNGANIAVSILLHNPTDFRQAILFRPLFPTEGFQPNNLNQSVILQLNGRTDNLVSNHQAKQLHNFFRKCGAKAELYLIEQGHQLSQLDINLARQWLQTRA